MIAGALGPKPDEIRPSFWDRIEVRNGVSAMAWPDHVNTQSARQACPGTRPGRNQRRWRRVGALPPLPECCPSVTTSRRWSSKAISSAIRQLGIKSSMPSSVCSAAPLMTFFPAPEANDRRAASQLAVRAASVAPRKFLSAQWRFFHGIPHRAAA